MPRLEKLRNGSFLAAFALVLGACSFFSDFPDVVEDGTGGNPSGAPSSTGTGTPQSSGTGDTSSQTASSSTSPDASSSSGADGGGGAASSTATGSVCLPTGGNGGAGGAECEICEQCWPGRCGCPEGEAIIDLRAPSSELDREDPPTSVFVNDIVVMNGNIPRYVGHGRDETVSVTLGLDGLFVNGGNGFGLGFVLDEDGDLVVAAAACSASPSREVFFFQGTRADTGTEQVVVAGAYEAEGLVFFDEGRPLDCEGSSDVDLIDGPPGASPDTVTAFLAWIDADGRVVEHLTPSASGFSMLVDVADLSDGAVVAVGVGSGDIFDTGLVNELDGELFLVRSDGQDSQVRPLGLVPCDDFQDTYSVARENSVAVDRDDRVWVAGTGCPGGRGTNRGYLAQYEWDGLSLNRIGLMTIHADDQPLSIQRVAVSQELVVIAGTHLGQPTIAGPGDLHTADVGGFADGFVMAFSRAAWMSGGEYLWSTPIIADDLPVKIDDLVVDDFGTIYVAGQYGTTLDAGGVVPCFEQTIELEAKAFFIELDPSDGMANWIRVEGFDGGEPGEAATFYTEGTAIAPVGDAILTATASHGLVELVCDDVVDSKDPSRPHSTVRRLSLNGSPQE